MINIALIGTWHVHFNGYATHAKNNKNCNITVLWDDDIERGKSAAEKYNCDFEPDYEALLAREDVDAVMVCTATNQHYDIIKMAALAGKHIFTEKVLCFTYAQAIDVAHAIKEAGVKFCISFPWRSRGDFLWIKEAVDNGLIGKINYCRMRNAHNGVTGGWLPQSFFDKESCGGGAMMDLGAHPMYLLNWFMGEPVKASSAFTNVRVNTVEDNAVTIMTYKDGAIGVSETAFVSEFCPFELELVGDKGTILSGGFMDKTCYNIGDGWVFPKLKPNMPEPLDMWINGIVNDTDIPYDVDAAVALSKTMELAYNNII